MSRYLFILLILLISSVALGSAVGRAEASDTLCDQWLHYYAESSTEPLWESLNPVGSMLVVRFTPAESNVLVGARFYIPADPMYPFNVRIFDKQRTLLPYNWVVTPRSVGWVELKINEQPKFNADFYVALEYTHRGATTVFGTYQYHGDLPWLGSVADKNLSGRSYLRYEDGTWKEAENSFMIEAIMSGRYSLDIESPVGGSTGAGCYNPGATAQISTPLIVTVGVKRYVFTGWTGDISQTTNQVALQLTEPVTHVKANYKTQYYLLVTSTFNLTGAGWYDDGSLATVSANPVPVEGVLGLLGARYVLDGWAGGATGHSASVSIKMDSPKAVTALWRTEYTMLYVTVGAITFAIVCALIITSILRKSRRRSMSEKGTKTGREGSYPTISHDRMTEHVSGPEDNRLDRRYVEYLAKLEDLRTRGDISDATYLKLKDEYRKRIMKGAA